MKTCLKKITLCALLGVSISAQAADVLIPNGDFATPGGADFGFFQSTTGVVSFPATGGSGDDGGYGLINNTVPGASWGGGLVSPPDNAFPGNQGIPLANLGLVAGKAYTFSMDMKNFAGTGTGGLKLEAWNGGAGAASNTGDMPASGSSSAWATYSWNYTIPAGTTSIKIVPLLTAGPNGSGATTADSVGFDNIRVNNTPIVPPPIVPVVPNGNFETPGGASWAFFNDGPSVSYPATGGNPNGNAVINASNGGFGVLVANNNAPMSLASLGLTAGKKYTFQLDMKVISGSSPGGIKVEFVPTSSGDLRYSPAQIAALPNPVTAWNTYSFEITLPPACTQILVVPLWGQNSTVAYDNVRILLPPPPSATIEQGTIVGWAPTSEVNSYQVQKSADNSNWSNVGSPFTGNTVNTAFDASKAPFYRVQESSPSFVNGVLNPGFETAEFNSAPADYWGIGAAENGGLIYTAESYTGGFLPNSGSKMLVIESTTPASGPVTPPNTNVGCVSFAIMPSTQYTLNFRAAHVVKNGGANPQFAIFFYDEFDVLLSGGFESFSSVGSAWTTVSKTFTSPSNAGKMNVVFIQAMGTGNGWKWVTLLDDVSLPVAAPGGPIGVLGVTTNPGVNVSWDTLVGSTYQVRTSTTLSGWTNFGSPVLGDGNVWSVMDTITPPAKFYQVSETTP